MADQPKSEMFMQFRDMDDNPLLAECAAEKDKDDKMMKDFTPEDVDNYSDFFEITKFDFGVKVNSADKSKGDGQASNVTALPRGQHTPALQQQPQKGQKGDKKQGGDEWRSWRSATTDQDVDNLKYPFEVTNFKF